MLNFIHQNRVFINIKYAQYMQYSYSQRGSQVKDILNTALFRHNIPNVIQFDRWKPIAIF